MTEREQNVSQPFPNVIKTSLSLLAISQDNCCGIRR